MAPEIVRGEAGPSALADRFSMAVLLFILLFNDHPLQGQAEASIRVFDAAAMKRLYGTYPVFIFDPLDASNRPVPEVHSNALAFWDIYPQILKDIFTRAFTEGLHDPARRPTYTEWQQALLTAADSMQVCACGRQNFIDPTRSWVSCWKCSRLLNPPELPGGPIPTRVLRFFWIIDTSRAMSGRAIDALNQAIREHLSDLRNAADENPHASVEIKVLTYSSSATWVTDDPVLLENFSWTDVEVGSSTCAMGAALKALAIELSMTKMPDRALPPIAVLVSAAPPSDDIVGGLDALMAEPWGKKTVRLAVAVGEEADLGILRRFIGHPEIEPFTGTGLADLTNYIRWASTQVLKAASVPTAEPQDRVGPMLAGEIPPPPPAAPGDGETEIW